MVITLAIIGALAVLALVFRLSGIKWLRLSLSIGGNEEPPKQVNQ